MLTAATGLLSAGPRSLANTSRRPETGVGEEAWPRLTRNITGADKACARKPDVTKTVATTASSLDKFILISRKESGRYSPQRTAVNELRANQIRNAKTARISPRRFLCCKLLLPLVR